MEAGNVQIVQTVGVVSSPRSTGTEFLASSNFPSRLHSLGISGPTKGMEGSECKSRPSSQFCLTQFL